MTTAPEDSPATPFRSRFPLVPTLLILIILGVALFGEKGILRALQANRHKEALHAEIRDQEVLVKSLKKEVEALRSDPDYLEGIARRELGMVKEDELVYQFSKKPAPPPPEKP